MATDWQQAWIESLANFNGGRWDEAEEQCQQVLLAQPAFAPALHLRGLVRCQRGDLPAAIAFLRQAVQADARDADAWNNLGNAQRMLGQFDAALLSFQQAIAVEPRHHEATNNLGFTLQQVGRTNEAIEIYQRLIADSPDYLLARNNLACVLLALRRIPDALAVLDAAIKIAPDDVASLVNWGDALRQAGRFSDAEVALRHALSLSANHLEASLNLAGVFKDTNRREDARALYERLLAQLPNEPRLLSNYADLLCRCGRGDAAEPILRHALRQTPHFVPALVNLAAIRGSARDDDEATALYERALALQPQNAEAHCDFAHFLLSRGELRRGWEEYEWRVIADSRLPARPATPVWNGEPLTDRAILLLAEQGFGDTLQWIRFARQLKERGARRVIVVGQPALLPLLRCCDGVDHVAPHAERVPAHDVHCLLGSLPRHFAPNLDAIPCEVPYLRVPQPLIDRWETRVRELVGDGVALRIGIGWQGNPGYRHDHQRSVPLRYFEPLARLPGVRLISLQQGPGLEQLAALRTSPQTEFPITELPADRDGELGAFMDTAAIMRHLDLVICSDTSLVHLAGALGVKTWMPVGAVTDWRWLHNRDDSPWYPSLTIFRPPPSGGWDDVFEAMVGRLAGIG